MLEENQLIICIKDYACPALLTGMVVIMAALLCLGPEKNKLEGVADSSETIVLSLNDIWNGNSQKSIQKWLNTHFGGYYNTVRIHNQIEYSVFRDASGGFLQGRKGYCFSSLQSGLYLLGEDGNPSSWEEYEQFARSVAELQDRLSKSGKCFIYLLTPSKTEIMSDYLPWNLRLLKKRYSESSNSSRAMMIRAFDECGVYYYDATDDIYRQIDENKYTVYYKSAHHWSLTSAAYETRLLIDRLKDTEEFDIPLPEIRIDGLIEGVYQTDKDIICSQNLFFSPKEDYRIPKIEYKQADSSIFFFGTSYGRELADSLHDASGNSAFKEITYMQYFTQINEYKDGALSVRDFSQDDDIEEYNLEERIADADIIIMEQNAILGVRDTHRKFVNVLLEGLK